VWVVGVVILHLSIVTTFTAFTTRPTSLLL
jgi:hypothetical protein